MDVYRGISIITYQSSIKTLGLQQQQQQQQNELLNGSINQQVFDRIVAVLCNKQLYNTEQKWVKIKMRRITNFIKPTVTKTIEYN